MKNLSTNLFFTLLVAGSLWSTPVFAQINIDQSLTPEELVQDYLVGSGVSVSNVTFNGLPGDVLNTQLGLFSGQSQFIEFDEGIAMGTSSVVFLEGGFDGMVDPNIVGDPDLYALVNVGGTGFSVNNCAILEFDFVPNFEFLTVGYVFGSDEYPGYTCSSFNDAFGFFLSGPGISGPFSNDAVNIAVIPNTQIPVGINTVNSGEPSGFNSPENCLNANPNFVQDSIYFVENHPTLPDDIQIPGMTVNLYANYILQAGQTYHIKLAIADASDSALDSGVILEGTSFSAFPLSDLAESVNGVVSVLVFPNPATDVLNVSVPSSQSQQLECRILDMVGKAVIPSQRINFSADGTHSFDISKIHQGAYVLEMRDLDGRVVQHERFYKAQ